MIDLVKRQQALKDKITSRVHDKKNLHGYLTHTAERYHSCMGDFDNSILQSLLHEDLMYWEAISKGARNNENSFRDKIDMFLKT